MPAARLGKVVVAGIAVAAAVVSYLLTGPQAIGGHDEGVYLATARALVESGEYRLINLPSAPLQTKYPPAYPALLALAAKAFGADSQHAQPLKAVNAVCLAIIVVLTAELARRFSGGGVAAGIGAALLTATSLGFVTHVDLIASDLLFVAALLAALLLMGTPSIAAGIASGCLLGLALLARTAGLAAILGKAVRWRVGGGRHSLALLGPALLTAVSWAAWSSLYHPRVGPLEEYYVGYADFAWFNLFSHPGFTWHVVTANVAGYLQVFPAVAGVPNLITTLLLVAGASVGLWHARRNPSLHDAIFMAVVYGVMLVGFPYAFGRYLLPAVPLLYALIASATQPAGGSGERSSPTTLIARLCLGLLLGANVLELRHYSQQPVDRIHVGFAQYLPFGRSGFLQTAEWIRRHTPEDARLGSANDTTYFTLTGRRGARPWPYEPELYDSRYGGAPPRTPVDVPDEIGRLGINYIVIDPFLDDLQPYAEKYLSRILHGPNQCWTQVFESDDSLHRVYQRMPGPTCGLP